MELLALRVQRVHLEKVLWMERVAAGRYEPQDSQPWHLIRYFQ